MHRLIVITFIVFLFCAGGMAQDVGPLELEMERLPQEPISPKGASDLADEGLRGKVKMVVIGSSDLSQQSVIGPRQASHLMLFNEKGHFVQRDYYIRGRPDLITQYGYIDGKRVAKSRPITYDDDPPPPPGPLSAADPAARDWRYNLAYQSTYANGKLAEMKLFSNNSKLITRTVYKRSKDQIEKFVYTADGDLNQKILMKLDQDGNVVEETLFGLQNYHIYGDKKYRFTYEFDKEGNWIKKAASREFLENGKSVFKPAYVQFRTITYF